MMDEGRNYLVRIDGCNGGLGQVRYSFLKRDCKSQTFVISGEGAYLKPEIIQGPETIHQGTKVWLNQSLQRVASSVITTGMCVIEILLEIIYERVSLQFIQFFLLHDGGDKRS